MPTKQVNVDEYYDEISEGYNELYGEEQRRKLSLIRPFIKEPVLDVGCGTGIASPDGAYGIDPSLGMIKKHPGFTEGRVVQGDAENLPFEDNQFYTIISLTALHHCKNSVQALKEIKRVGVRAIISILKTVENFESLKENINKIFNVQQVIVDEKDVIFIC